MVRAAARSDEGYPARDGRRRLSCPQWPAAAEIQRPVRPDPDACADLDGRSSGHAGSSARPLLPCCSRSGVGKRLLELRPLLDGTATPAPSTFPMPAKAASGSGHGGSPAR